MTVVVITPNAISDAQLIATNVPETVAVWNAATVYAIGDQVRLDATHTIYASLQAANLNHNPDTDTSSPPFWKEVSPTNAWAMFDQVNSTQTTQAANITVQIKPGLGTGLYLGGLTGTTAHVSMVDEKGATVYDSGDIDLDGSVIVDWYDYFFGELVQKTELYLTNLPMYLQGVITVTVTGGGNVAIGTLVQGIVSEYADVKFGAQAGMISYSRKDTDSNTGVTTFIKKGYAKKNNYTMEVPKASLKKVWDSLLSLDATPAVFIGIADDDYSMFVLYGFYRNFTIAVSYPTYSVVDLELEGLS
jgi:hypothetical protein